MNNIEEKITKQCRCCFTRKYDNISNETKYLILKKRCNFQKDNIKCPNVLIVPDDDHFEGIERIFGLNVIVSPRIKHMEDIEVF